MKKVLTLLFIFFALAVNFCSAQEDSVLRDYSEIEVPSGTFVPVISTQEISTLYCDIGSTVNFISTTDLFLYDTNVIPQNSEFVGYIEKINEPIVGSNASMKIRIAKLRYPDGFEIPMKGYIYTVNGNTIGGELTEPAKYDVKPSYRQGCVKLVGYVPGNARRMGEHKVIAAGADLLVVLTAPLPITHTVTN